MITLYEMDVNSKVLGFETIYDYALYVFTDSHTHPEIKQYSNEVLMTLLSHAVYRIRLQEQPLLNDNFYRHIRKEIAHRLLSVEEHEEILNTQEFKEK